MLEEEVKNIGVEIMALHKSYSSVINEAIDDFIRDDADLGFMFDEAKKRYLAAKRGLALTNKLQDPLQRKEHKSRVLSNLNKLRAIFNRLEKAVQNAIQVAQGAAQNKDLFQPQQNGIRDQFNQSNRAPTYNQSAQPEQKPQPEMA